MINRLTYVPAPRADAGAASTARAGASLAAVSVIDSALDGDAGAAHTPPHPDPGSPRARFPMPPSDPASAQVAARTPIAAEPVPAVSLPLTAAGPANGIVVTLSTRAVAGHMDTPSGGSPEAPGAVSTPSPGLMAQALKSGFGSEPLLALHPSPLTPGSPMQAATASVHPQAQPAMATQQQEPADMLRNALTALGGAVPMPRAGDSGGAAPPSPQPSLATEVRAESYPPSGQLVAAMSHVSVAAAESKSVAAAIAQARDAERLAGLALRPEIPSAPSQPMLSKLVLGAVILGALLLILL